MSFVQIIDFETSRYDEIDVAIEKWRAETSGARATRRSVTGRDRERPTRHIAIIEFPSYEDAMRNSALPQTAELADRIRELCSGEPVFINLDVVRSYTD
jgi:hypothetical protein